MAESLHLAMLPWLAFGHLLPFLQLSIALARAGFRISFISTPKNIQRLPKLPQDLTAQIRFVELPLPPVEGLDEGAESTADISAPNDDYLKKAYDLLVHPFERFVADQQQHLDFIVHDLLACWTAEIACRYGVPRVLFSIYSASPIAYLGLLESMSSDEPRQRWRDPLALTSSPPWFRFPSTVAFRLHEATQFSSGFFKPDASGVSIAQRLSSAVQGCEAIVLRSCDEYEGEHLNVLKKYPKPVIPIGLLPPEERKETAFVGQEGESERIFRWLDGKAPRSVVFVVFGSECKLSRSQVTEIAHGLELSELSFLWALRSPTWAADDSDALPPGFVTRTMGHGIVNLGWAPQLEIVAHPAIGGCMFHAGWSTFIEAVQCGHALVLLPFSTSQRIDARLSVEKGLGLEVEREEDGGPFKADAIAKSLRRAMVGDEGAGLRLKSKEFMAVFSDAQLHERYLIRFVDFLKSFNIK